MMFQKNETEENEMYDDYVQYMAPNNDRLKDLVTAARGEKSMADFAEIIKRTTPSIKVSAPTLSRIGNGVNKNPISLELLDAIAKVADKNSNVTFDVLARANGYRTKEENEKAGFQDRRRSFMRERMQAERNCRMIIQNEISARGYQFKPIPRNLRNSYSEVEAECVFSRVFTFGFSVSGLSPASIWKFALDSSDVKEEAYSHEYELKENIDRIISRFIRECACIFASDSYEDVYYENEKFSFVFRSEILYKAFIEKMKNITVNGFMTVILIDLDGLTVKEETQINRNDGATKLSFFKEPLIGDEEEDNNEDFFFFFDPDEKE